VRSLHGQTKQSGLTSSFRLVRGCGPILKNQLWELTVSTGHEISKRLYGDDIFRLRAFLASSDGELDLLAFSQSLETLT
jgi:hypothetical protein